MPPTNLKCWGIERILNRPITPGNYHFSSFVTIVIDPDLCAHILFMDTETHFIPPGPDHFTATEIIALALHLNHNTAKEDYSCLHTGSLQPST